MVDSKLPPVAREDLKSHVLSALRQYWSRNSGVVAELPVRESPFPNVSGPLRLVLVSLPEWAHECGVGGKMAVPLEACGGPNGAVWQEVDWWLAAFLMLECWHERMWEVEHGPIHSYSMRLSGWDARVWDRAWVNRIALFFRRWAEKESSISENALLGLLPQPEFVLTHDVDAISKTLSIRLKQCAFNLFNAARAVAGGNLRRAKERLAQAARFLFSREDWWTFDRLIQQEKKAGIRSHFNFYADCRPKTLARWLFDPAYDISSPRLSDFIKKIHREGWVIGLHPAFDAWQNQSLICAQRSNVERISGSRVNTCRQHWLRFGWGHTWTAQSSAGIRLDTTLMFNDRPGFRAAVALSWTPWDPVQGRAHHLSVLPTVLMDSHLYDYQQMTAQERKEALLTWLGEVHAVGGKIAVVWHPHTLTNDYGWSDGFKDLIETMERKTAC